MGVGCLHCRSSVLPLHSQLNYKPKLKVKEQLWLSCKAPCPSQRLVLQLQRQNLHPVVSLRTNAISDISISTSLFIANSKVPPSQSGDITDFLRISALLLVVYFLANFVAPYFISKYFEFDKAGEDEQKDK